MKKVLSSEGSPEQVDECGAVIKPATGIYNQSESSLTPDQMKLLNTPSEAVPFDSFHINGSSDHHHYIDGIRIPDDVTIVKSFPIRMKCILAKRNAGK